MQSHFMPQRLSTVPERYTYSSLSKMFMERNHHQEKTNSWVRRCCPLWGIYFCGNLDNGTCVWLKCRMPKSTKERWLWGKTRNKNQRWRESVTSIPACVTTPKMEFLRLEGGGREVLSLLMQSNLPGSGQKTPGRQTSWRKRYPTHQNPLQLPSRAKAIQDPQETSFNQKSLLLTLKQNESSSAKCN